MTSYLLTLGLWVLVMGAVALYWYRRIDRHSREWAARREQEAAEDRARFETNRAEWEARHAVTRADYAAAVSEAEASIERGNQFWLKRGMEPTKPPESSDTGE